MAQIKRYLADAEQISSRATEIAGIRGKRERLRAFVSLLRECESIAGDYMDTYQACRMLRLDAWDAYMDERAELERGTSQH